jgi:mono/diheme cytochrome c family protein
MCPRPTNASRPLRWFAAALLLASVLPGLSALAQTPQAPPPGDPASGKKIFQVKCVPCHKADGSGGIKLTGNPTPNWRDPKRMSDPKHGDDYLRDCMTHGKIKSGMQPITKIGVDLKDIPNLIAYVRTFSQAKK